MRVCVCACVVGGVAVAIHNTDTSFDTNERYCRKRVVDVRMTRSIAIMVMVIIISIGNIIVNVIGDGVSYA